MLEQSFIHLPGIGPDTERSLWNQGCTSWQDLLDRPETFSYGSAEKREVMSALGKSVHSLQSGDFRHFRSALGSRHSWRGFPDFRRTCVYLDIETDGGNSGNSVTTIGLYDGEEFRCLVRGIDLETFPEAIAGYGMIVTFYGAGFDLPMLLKCFPGLRFDQIHLDLCFALKQLGIRGGLKKIEKQLNIGRSEQTDGLNGLDAIRLWGRYRHLDDAEALETLIAYNREDVVNLEQLAEYTYQRLWERTRQPRLSLD